MGSLSLGNETRIFVLYSNDIDIDIDIEENLISAIRFVHNLSVVDNTRLDAVDQVDDGEGRLDGCLVLVQSKARRRVEA